MQARAFLAALIVSTMVFSGCLGGDDGTPASTTGTSGTSATAPANGTAGATGPAGANQAPVAIIKVLQNGTEIPLVNESYAVDASMNVTLDASGSSDADGDELEFTWMVNETELDSMEAIVNVSLAAGNHTIDLVVSDGADEAITSLAIVAASAGAAGPAGGALIRKFTGSFAQGSAGPGVATPRQVHKFMVPEGAQKITVWLKWTALYSGQPLSADLDLYLHDAKNTQVASSAQFYNFEYIAFADATKIMAGEWSIQINPYVGAAGASYTADVIVWVGAPTATPFTGSFTGSVNVDEGTPAETAPKVHKVQVSEGATVVVARLTWLTQANSNSRVPNDLDLSVQVANKEVASSGNAVSFEFAMKAAAEGETLGSAAEWSFVVTPFSVAQADYTLLVEYI